jgi:hypothetical protein
MFKTAIDYTGRSLRRFNCSITKIVGSIHTQDMDKSMFAFFLRFFRFGAVAALQWDHLSSERSFQVRSEEEGKLSRGLGASGERVLLYIRILLRDELNRTATEVMCK